MPNLRIKNHKNQEATIFLGGEGLEIKSSDIKFENEINKLLTKYSKSGVIIFTEPEKMKPNEITIISKRIFSGHPLFLESLGKQLKTYGYKVIYQIDKEKILRKELENEVRRLLDDLLLAKEDQKIREKISLALNKMSYKQLEIIKNDLAS